ncbi:protein translocase subunit SecF [Ornithinimicrobium pekingense]|uniref:Protein-export membrane protein SecF n=1 Tax=Ornithinimicrobium pekingense TaxID=384677 RepID=A0ABQ2FBK6_9MICO|nr:protein translocase subunit SecF [Ornithinimicrobium pekingense]GGK76333.1 protein-export membrane protein SecF [Ornithinimicrobium pekingense]
MSRFSQLGNDLYSGKKSYDIVGRRNRFYLISLVLTVVSLVGLLGLGLNFGIEFRGGTELRVSAVQDMDGYESRAGDVVDAAAPGETTTVTRIGDDTVRVQTGEMEDLEAEELRADLAEEFGVPVESVTSSLVGPSWGETVTQRALIALGVFLALVTVVLSLYFRTWKMAVAALVALVHDVLFTLGIYALIGIEVSPASVIGFLTILGYSIYDTIVVFDKVRENTDHAFDTRRMTYAEAANLAVNQTIVRSINTSIVALLPVAVILLVGITLIGPGTLVDLSWALFIGIAVGTYSSIFIATPLLVHLRQGEAEIKKHDSSVTRRAERAARRSGGAAGAETHTEADTVLGPPSVADEAEPAQVPAGTGPRPSETEGAQARAQGRQLHPYAQRGPRNQPRRKRRG